MRLWLSDDERRPDPAPARADGRKAVVAGTLGWVVALVACLVFREPLESAGLGWFIGAAITGIAIGLIGLAVVQVIRRRADQSSERSTD
ncbi:DUF2530 domain-containing protein [Agromyces cerinus]|uniref:DUF2530 domain-containing protein n=1 Tax=Agromyces cerinus subsp. cerinus TaxID=232089 RepID=A0A1N6I1D7_9MICO|nr:DUF2530 domain-containing protein [Agromyces cerinus]SIO25864.1 Protein of unknown function [Agromyces cerinus subsp. cerinus]